MARVALVTHYYPAHRGGVERVAGLLAERLAHDCVARIVWHASDCDPAPAAQTGLTPVPASSWNGIERRLGFPYPVWSPTALARLARACRDADVVHLHDCLYLANLVAFATARLARTPVLVTQHIGHVPYRNPLLRAAHWLANRTLGAWVLGGAHRVAYESEAVREYFDGFVRYRSPSLLVPNGVDTAVFRPAEPEERERLRRRLGVPGDTPLLLFVGRFVEKKGLRVLRELTGSLPYARWLFAGWGPLDPAAWNQPNVTVMYKPGPEDLTALYQAADLLLLPSVGEGFPLSVQEAMACGTPALVSDEIAAACHSAGDLLLAESVLGTTPAARWKVRIRSLLASPATLAALRPRVSAFARAHWDWDRCAERYAALLRDCVTEKQNSSRLGKHSAERPER